MWSSRSPRGGILSSVHAKKGTTQSSATAQWSLRLKTVTPPDIHQRQTLAEAPPGGLASARPLWRLVSGPVTPSVHDRVRDVALVGVIRPGALHRISAVAHAHVRRGALTRADPRALVTVFLARELVGPAAGRILVGHGFGVLVTVHDREAIESSGRAAVDEILTAALAEIGDVRHVGERQIAVRGSRVVVPGAEVRGGRVEAVRVGAGGRDDHVLHVAVGGGRGVAEVGSGPGRLRRQLRGGGIARRVTRGVEPDSRQSGARRGTDVRCTARTGQGPRRAERAAR